uniref:Uncharacterized protein n=1 Tax=Arundo donax TaxID=35708 RepID=A0A0A9FQ65_ARUDO
MVCTRQHQTVG